MTRATHYLPKAHQAIATSRPEQRWRARFNLARGLMRFRIGVTSVISLLAWVSPLHGQSSPAAHATAPTPDDPYPLSAAGWGPEAGNGRFFSRWAEDWTGLRVAGQKPLLKAIPLGGEASLTLSAEARLRCDFHENSRLIQGNDYQQRLFRGILGADLHINSHLRVYGEIGTGHVAGRRTVASANFQNDASLQQLFVDAHGYLGSALVGAMVGRQEFADGPRQLISLSDGPNLHRTWNGVRLYAHWPRFRLGAFDLSATRQEEGMFDEWGDEAERLQGLNASLILSRGPKDSNIYLDPFWIHSDIPEFRSGGRTGLDNRDTYGVRVWGRRGGLRFDWTLARQMGEHMDRDIDAWGLFAVQSLQLSDHGWKPRLTAHIDVASGGAAGSGTLEGFNQLYASSGYLGEARFLSLSNLVLIAPGISFSPASNVNVSAEYGFARRFAEDDAVYGGGMRAYPGTQNVSGHKIGGLLRISASWAINEYLTLFFNYEHLAAGDVLSRARQPSASYGYLGATFRF